MHRPGDEGGTSEFLTKPVDPPVLIAVIRAAFAEDSERRLKSAHLQDLQRRFSRLTPREREILPLIVAGMLNKQGAARLGIREVTLQVQHGQITRKMEALSFADLARMTEKLGVYAPDGDYRNI